MLTIIGAGNRLQDLSVGAMRSLMQCDAAILQEKECYLVEFLQNSEIPHHRMDDLLLPRKNKAEQAARMAKFVADLAHHNHICYIVRDLSHDISIHMLCAMVESEAREMYPCAPTHTWGENKTMPYHFGELVDIVKKLRNKESGCPWDIEQDHYSLRENIVEESWEVVDAIDSGQANRLYDELGDVLLQVVMHANIAEEAGAFTLDDITDTICRKLIYRHPHIFKDITVSGTEEVLQNWEELKKKEKGLSTQADVLRDVPKSLPSALRAHKVQKKARQVGFDWDSPEGAFAKVEEELRELREAYAHGNEADIEHEAGDLLFSAVNAARLCGTNSELTLHSAARRFIERFARMEELATAENLRLADMDLETMDKYWEKAKNSLLWGRFD